MIMATIPDKNNTITKEFIMLGRDNSKAKLIITAQVIGVSTETFKYWCNIN